jgi:hypothetical protein
MPLYRLGDIEDNPYFISGNFEVHRKKIDALKESMNRTGAWGGWVARIGPNNKPQQAFGHHRKRAALELYGDDYTIDLIIENLTDADMIRMMADENAQEWEHDAFTTINTVRAVVEALAAEHIRLPELADNTRPDYIRLAPSFKTGSVRSAASADRTTRKRLISEYRTHPAAYTAATVAGFLGWTYDSGLPKHGVIDALDALEFMEEQIAYPETFSSLSIEQLHALVSEMRRRQESHMRGVRSSTKAIASAQRRVDKAETDEERQQAIHDLEQAREKQPVLEEVRSAAASESALIADKLSRQFKEGELSARNTSQIRSSINRIEANGSDGSPTEIDYNDLAESLIKVIDRILTDDKKTAQDLKIIKEQHEDLPNEICVELNRALNDASIRFIRYMLPVTEQTQAVKPEETYAPNPPIHPQPEPQSQSPYVQPQQPPPQQPPSPQDAFTGRRW